MCGKEQPGEKIFLNLSLAGQGWREISQNFPRWDRVGKKKVKIFSAGACLVWPKHTNSRQNVQNQCQDEPIPCHGEKKVKTFLAGAPPARKILTFRPEEFSSRHSPLKAVSGKKRQALVETLTCRPGFEELPDSQQFFRVGEQII